MTIETKDTEELKANDAFGKALAEWTEVHPSVDVQAARFFFFEGAAHGIKTFGEIARDVVRAK